ncbi:hypothetical protein [Rhizobium sp. AB2/73]|uniref:hypothetical protein n=1 Tax=Rhizobium sp. AB2/73 TaxID=2795216 RepID=UPI000DDF3425|nr:hypothetical protein [Rhizobium sp. AB2/73]QYA16356.1 hypothetical protein J5284_30845 [Rhizobium sp. AB2/73]UEQ84899.1 hypothetical protein I8E17_27145 [Rhizobium sp. AB2/73]
MTGKKTHEQQVRVIEKRENTSNAGDDFNAEAELKHSKQEREAHLGGAKIRGETPGLVDKDDRQMIPGQNQESGHHKRPTGDR